MFDSYARLSWNPSTRELEKIETQHRDNDATIARHGGTVGRYLDDGLSAWKAGVRRKDFETLLERAQADQLVACESAVRASSQVTP